MPTNPTRERRLFSLDEANRTLPLVRRIVTDIVRAEEEIERLHHSAVELAAAGRTDAAEKQQDELQALTHAVEDFVRELELIGCELKDPRRGLIDFPARLGDRVVYLCWRLGEERVTHWHELFAGFDGRRPTAEKGGF